MKNLERRKSSSKQLPPGDFGAPVVGSSAQPMQTSPARPGLSQSDSRKQYSHSNTMQPSNPKVQRVQLEAIDHNISNQKIADLMNGLEQRPIHLMGKT
jgi:hypothetical protein